jgi:O-antigen/teichoic acid export membrane protein
MNTAETTSRWAMVWPFLVTGIGLVLVAFLRALVFHGDGDLWLLLSGLVAILVGLGMAVKRWTVRASNRVARVLGIAVPILLIVRMVTWFL